MPIQVTPRDYSNSQQPPISVDPPDVCPLCHSHIEPRLQTAYLTPGGESGYGSQLRLEVVFACPRRTCQQLFIGRYSGSREPNTIRWSYRGAVPLTGQKKIFETIVTDVSRQFAPIYNQAFEAEQLALDQICGPGYRKALEFLVKDYAKAKNPTATDEIEKKMLAACIAEYIDHPGVKSIARRATWLGNDETHYLRKWENKDLQDLKKLIELTAHWINVDLLSAEVVEGMPDPKTAGSGA